ncbi:MAG TPA: excinuclease ABC subunit UvrA, partial [Bacteroidia bacterium]|nr:excinuclease ABC subunit UvrA [Bacteroidia bacterium]
MSEQETEHIVAEEEFIEVFGAAEHNLKNIDVRIPRHKLVVITGLSGSGKSSLAFDTIYAEGQRRFMETFSAYARQFLGSMERPEVEKINGLSPVISIEQKSANLNPRSTVGTVTEIYDFLRLLFARAGEAFSYMTDEKMVRLSDDEILKIITERFSGKKIGVLAPLVKGRKGHYRELFEQLTMQGFLRVRTDGRILDLRRGLQVDRYKTHDIELVVDRLDVSETNVTRLKESLQEALRVGKGSVMIMDMEKETDAYYSRHLMCPTSGISYDEPAPNSFSFNSPYGACRKCNGIGTVTQADIKSIIPNPSHSIKHGGIAPLGQYRESWIFRQVEALGKIYGFTLNTPINEISEEAINAILYGSEEVLHVEQEFSPGVANKYALTYEGIVTFIISQDTEFAGASLRRWIQSFMQTVACPECHGARLKKE